MSPWVVVCADGAVEPIGCEDEEYAQSVCGYFDSNAATGAPMDCSPHRAVWVPEETPR